MLQRPRKKNSQVNSLPTLAEIREMTARKFAADDRKREAGKESDQIRAHLLAYAARTGKVGANGHRDVIFPEPIVLDGTPVKGFRRERRESTYLDEEAAIDLVEERGVADEVIETVTIRQVNQDKLYALQQRGVITREELASLFVREHTYSIKRL